MPEIEAHKDLISVIITVLNGDKWVDTCMKSIVKQSAVRQNQHHRQQQQQQHTHEAQTPFMSDITSSPTLITTTTITPTSTHPATITTTATEVQATSHSPECHEHNNHHTHTHTQLSAAVVDIEVCVFDDCSCDDTYDLLTKWKCILWETYKIEMKILQNETGNPKGVGCGRNRAIEASAGTYLCFQDIDDEMLPERIWKQYILAKEYKNAIIGSKFIRLPANATCRFTKWANNLTPDRLTTQIYTSNGPTIIMPTWMCHRNVYNQVKGGFSEEGKGCPEDLIFFYKHLDNQGSILRVEECLLQYRYHSEATTFTVQANTIWHIRLKHLLDKVLGKQPWSHGFSIWNAGKQGRKLFRDLPEDEKKKVRTFCDVDKNKINKFYKYYDCSSRQQTFSIPIVHFTQVQPPIIVCMKLDLTNGAFEMNLQSLKLIEGKDYILFA